MPFMLSMIKAKFGAGEKRPKQFPHGPFSVVQASRNKLEHSALFRSIGQTAEHAQKGGIDLFARSLLLHQKFRGVPFGRLEQFVELLIVREEETLAQIGRELGWQHFRKSIGEHRFERGIAGKIAR